jgi:2-desacetyl-2-hydroxyethyl bacteriochlorophyllide A dehydrogenase
MKAVVFHDKGNLSVEEYPLQPLKEGWVRVKIEEAGICGSDLHVLDEGYYMKPGDMEGKILGHENAGVVAELGPGVRSVREGERVGVKPWITCHRCRYCESGWFVHCPTGGITGYEYLGGFAEFLDVPEVNLYSLPDSVSFTEATQLDAAACGVHAVAIAGLRPQATIVVIGDGTIGLMALQAVSLSSPRHLVMVGKHENNLRLAQEFGATDIVNLGVSDPIESIEDITAGAGADIVIEAVGRKADTVSDAVTMAAPTGRVIIMGAFTEPRPIPLKDVLFKNIQILGSLVYGYWAGYEEFQLALDLIEAGKVQVEPLVTHKFPLENVKEAIHAFTHKSESGAMKVILSPGA